MHNYHFCVIIPTRNRCNELFHTLKTVVNQSYPLLTILVSNNASSDETSKVVASFNDLRIKYIEVETPLGMSEHWEYALNNATGDYITFLGDDDGLCIDCVEQWNQLLNIHPTCAITWTKIEYCWPEVFLNDYKNYLSINLNYKMFEKQGLNTFLDVVNCKSGYTTLPCIYNSIVKLELVKKVQKETSNVFFRAKIPDLYSGLILGYYIESYIYSNYPFSINGASQYSNGWLGMKPSHNQTRYNEFFELSEKNNKYDNRDLFKIGTFCACIMDSLNASKEVFGTIVMDNIDFYVEQLVKETQILNEERYIGSYFYLEKYIQEIGKVELFRELLKKYPHKPSIFKAIYGYNPTYQTLSLKGDNFNVKNVFDATLLCNKLLTPWSQIISDSLLLDKPIMNYGVNSRKGKLSLFFTHWLEFLKGILHN